MKILLKLTLISTLTLLSSCALFPETREAREARIKLILERQYKECEHLGFKIKTEAFGNCILQLKAIAIQREVADAQRSNANANTMKWLQGK